MVQKTLILQLEEWTKRIHLPLMPVIWGITCLVIGALVTIGLYGYYSAERAIAKQFNHQQYLLAQQAARGIENYLTDIRNQVIFSTQHPLVQSLPNVPEKDRLRTLFEAFAGKVAFLFLENQDGTLTSVYPSATLENFLGKTFRSQPHFQKAWHTGKAVLQAHLPEGWPPTSPVDPPSGRMLISAPIFRHGEFIGVLGVGLDWAQISKIYLDPVQSGTTGGAWMISPEGEYVTRYQTNRIEQEPFKTPPGQNASPPPKSLAGVMRPGMLQSKPGMGEYIEEGPHRDSGRLKKLIAYAPVRFGEPVGWVAVVVPYAEATQLVWSSFKNSIVLLFIMIGTLLAGTYIGHKINQERIRAEEKVRWGEEVLLSRSRLQALFDGAPDAIIIVDRQYRISTVNQTGLTWYKQPLKNFIGKYCHQEFQGRPEACVNCPAEESFRTGQPAYRERASLVADGTKHYLHLFTFPLRDRNGEVTEVVEYVKDVTSEMELQQQILQAERLTVVGAMAANMAHEIKNPLSTIVLNAELLDEELQRLGFPDQTETRTLLGGIQTELDRLREVIEEYLQYARLPKVKLERGDVNEVVALLLAFLKEEIADRHIMLADELEPHLPTVPLDAKQLHQALLNLIKNSLEAMPQGGKLTVSTASKNGQIEIIIADTGKGIPDEEMERVFRPFYSTKHGGTGLGLPITEHIIKEHRGNILVQSSVDLGTLFTIRLPIPWHRWS
jgi:PAS domain S-box-containing protein